MRVFGPISLGLVLGAGLLGGPSLSARQDSKAGIEFFEKKIRPILVERCYV